MLKYRLLTGLFVAGAVIGFGSGFASLRNSCKHHRDAHRQQLAEMCADAALRARASQAQPAAGAQASSADTTADTRPGER